MLIKIKVFFQKIKYNWKTFSFLCLIILIFGISGCKEKVVIVVDNSVEKNEKCDNFINRVKNYIKSKHNTSIEYEVIIKEKGYEDFLKKPKMYNDKISKNKKDFGMTIAIKPFKNRYSQRMEYLVSLGTTNSDSNINDSSTDAVKGFEDVEKKLDIILKNKKITDIKSILSWGKELKSLVEMDIDYSAYKNWSQTDFRTMLTEFVETNSNRKFDLVESNTRIKDIDAISADPRNYYDNIVDHSVYDYAQLYYVKPFLTEDTKKMEFEVTFLSSLVGEGATIVSEKKVISPELIFDEIKSGINDKTILFDECLTGYSFKKEKKILLKNFEFKSYSEIINSKGVYLLVKSIGQIYTDNYLNVEDVLTDNSLDFSKIKLSLIFDHINKNDGVKLFYNEKGESLQTKITFFEHIKTGGQKIRILYGPIDENEYKNVINKLRTCGITCINEIIYPYDLK